MSREPVLSSDSMLWADHLQSLNGSSRKVDRMSYQTEATEELEDEDGNVYNRKTYEDLKKQGIIR